MTITENDSTATSVVLPELPVLDAPAPRSALVLVLPAVMLAGTVGFLILGGGGATSWLMGGLMIVSLVGMMASGGSRRSRPAAEVAADREKFLRRLSRAAGQVETAASVRRGAALRRHPSPDLLIGTARGRQLPGPSCPLRVGVGPVPAVVDVDVPDEDADTEPEPYSELARRRFVEARRVTPGMPLTVGLVPGRSLIVTGSDAGDVARNLILRTVRSVTAGSLRVVLCAPDDTPGWDWLAWLPDHHDDAPAVQPLRTADSATVVSWLVDPGRIAADVTVLLVLVAPSPGVDRRCRAAAGPTRPLLVVAVHPTAGSVVASDDVLRADGGALTYRDSDGHSVSGTADLVGPSLASVIVRSWADTDVTGPVGRAIHPDGTGPDLPRLLGLADAESFSAAAVQDRVTAPLRIPIGVDAAGATVHLDLREASMGGVGPHGLLIGATGSGKSELLRTVVLALAATHGTAALNLVLVDFKGGAAFLGLDGLPHVSALITNLAAEAALVDRMQDALEGELRRRQEVLRAAGVSSATDYAKERSRRPDLPPLPALVVVCDEFTELLVQRPDLADTFVQLGRLGRSLDVHLLLAAQRMEEGRMRGLDAHLSYRIALRTFSAADSRAVIDDDRAYRLHAAPGTGYLKAGADAAVRFRTAYVSGPGAPPLRRLPASRNVDVVSVLATLPRRGAVDPAGPATPVPDPGDTPTLLALWVNRLRGHGAAAHQIWLPPLTVSAELSQLPVGEALRVPVGVVDRPRAQRQDLLWADFTGSSGHGVVVGGIRSGKSSLLATIVHALARRHPVSEMHCYVVDLGGGTLASLAALPQVGAVARGDDARLVRRTVAHLTAELARRERVPGDAPDVFLVIDGWAAFRAAFEDLEPAVTSLVLRGLAHGVHVLLATGRWSDVRPAMKDQLGLRLELRLGDPAESEADRRLAAAVPARCPGRGLTTGRDHFLAALPGVGPSPADHPDGTAVAPRIRLLPPQLAVQALPAGVDVGIPVGLAEDSWKRVSWDPAADPHLIVWGDGGSGKTTFLQTLAAGLAGRHRDSAARLLVIDHRRTLLGRLPVDHVAGHGTTPQATARLVADAVEVLVGRLPPVGDLTPEQLREHRWWSGPELYVLVDDHDMVATGADPLRPLLDLVPHGRDIGLHLVVCRRAAGGGRALYDPLLQLIRELGAPGLLLSGPPDEGPLHGDRRPGPQPPGRGWWVTRDGASLIQLAVSGPSTGAGDPTSAPPADGPGNGPTHPPARDADR